MILVKNFKKLVDENPNNQEIEIPAKGKQKLPTGYLARYPLSRSAF